MLPWAILRRSASGLMSASSIWSAARTKASGTDSAGSTPVIRSTTSCIDSSSATSRVATTSMPASRIGAISLQRRPRARSSTRATCGRRAITAAAENSASTGRPASSAAVCGRSWVSTAATSTSAWRAARRRPSSSMAYVVPAPGAAPR
jgi:hypothetical protein